VLVVVSVLLGGIYPTIIQSAVVLPNEGTKERPYILNNIEATRLAYGLDKIKQKDQQVLVFDIGAGTLDVTIMNFGQGVFEVLSTSGDTHLGGKDMDDVITDYIINEFKSKEAIDLKNDKMAMQRIKEAVEKAKIELSSVLETEINLPFVTADAQGPKHMLMKITRAKLEELVNPLVEKCQSSINQAMNDAKLKPQDIEKVILVGGPTRMPIVQKFIENIFGQKMKEGLTQWNVWPWEQEFKPLFYLVTQKLKIFYF